MRNVLGLTNRTWLAFSLGSGSPEEMILKWEMLRGQALSPWLDPDEGLGIMKLSGQENGVYYHRKVNLQGYQESHCGPMTLKMPGRHPQGLESRAGEAHVDVTDSRPL